MSSPVINQYAERPAPTLPRLNLPEYDAIAEAREAAARIAERRMVRQGVDAWEQIGRSNSFEAWCKVGAALAIGKAHALRASGANAAWGRNYSRAFNDWIKEHHFEQMPKSVRSVAIDLHENIASITAWRAALPEKQRARLVHPLSNVRRWRASITAKPKPDAVKVAEAAWC